MPKAFKARLIARERLVGTIVTLSSPEIAEIISGCGFDWLFVDLEHSAMGPREAQAILQAVLPQVPCLVRVPLNDEIWIKKALDIGAAGLIIPQIRTADDAARAVRFCKYPPAGTRGVGIGRAHGYGAAFEDYVSSANDEIVVVVQIEHIDAVINLDAILEIEGIDCLFVGPYDLSASMGKMGQTDDPDVRAAIAKVSEGAHKRKMPLGIFGASVDAVQPYIDNGYNLITVGVDTLLLIQSAKKIATSLKG